MITNEKYVEIATGLLDKTKRKKVPWKQSDINPHELVGRPGPSTNYYGSGSGPDIDRWVLALQLSNSTVLLSFISPSTQPDLVSLIFLNKDNIVVDCWNVEDGDDNWPLAFELYQEASKQVNKWDVILEEVESFIGKP